MAPITINGITVDPEVQQPVLAAVGLEAADASNSDHLLIQTSAPLGASDRQSLVDLGVEVQEYVSENTYLARYPATDLAGIRALPFVTWADVYLRVFKVPPGLLAEGIDPRNLEMLADVGPNPNRVPARVDVLLHPNVRPTDDLVARIATAARVDPSTVIVTPTKVRVTAQTGLVADIAALDEVREIHAVPRRQLFNNVARQILDADVLVNGTTYDGAGELVAVADTGFDLGDAANPHPAFTGRVVKLIPLGRTAPARTDDPHGHGTHVAGSVLGDGNSATMGGAIRGTAPGARLILQSLLDSGNQLGGIPADLNDLFQQTYDEGARVHSNSWGLPGVHLPYDASSREIDEFVWNHPDQVICFAAGNDGTDADSNGVVDTNGIGSQSAAKNCITVGASESLRPEFKPSYGTYWPGDFPQAPIRRDRQANNSDGMVAFSSRGPTAEGRIKPDVVAPGTCILSTLSRAASMSSTFGASSDPLFFFDSGTSMATPLVAGSAAVLRQTLVKNGVSAPSAALVKGLLINGAVTLTGQYTPTEAGASPNNSSGWGRVDLAGSVIIPGAGDPNGGYGDGGPLKEGEEDGIVISIPKRGPGQRHAHAPAPMAGGATLKVTLVWSDPPGAQLQNDLDLIVVASDGTERHGNMGTGKGFDRTNNVEQVVWPNMPPGDAKIIIRAFRITQFAQPYAYVWRIS